LSFGLKVTNESGFIQFDEDSISFQILASGTSSAGYSQYISIPNNYPEDAFVVIRPHNPTTTSAYYVRGFMLDFTPNGGSRIRRAYMNSGTNAYALNQPCDYAIVVRADATNFTAPTSGYALNVYKQNGDLSFSSELPTYRVLSTRNYFISASNSGDGNWYSAPPTINIEDTYTFLSEFSNYRTRQYSLGGSERGSIDYYRYGYFDYPNNQYGLKIVSFYSDGPNGGSIYDYVWSGYRTEIIGVVG
jgi:hypothetical protein